MDERRRAEPVPVRRRSRVEARLDTLLIGGAVLPLLAPAQVLGLALTCVVRTGAWPQPYQPDPSSIALPLQVELCVVSLLLALVLHELSIGREARMRRWVAIGVHSPAYCAFWSWLWIDARHFDLGEWLMD